MVASLAPFARRCWPSRLPTRPLLRYLAFAGLFVFLASNIWLFRDYGIARLFRRPGRAAADFFKIPLDDDSHPIDVLIHDARTKHAQLLQQRSFDVGSAAARYRERRGRHPPPGFDKWVEHALATDSLIIEEYFDRIYHDVAPFWALDAVETRERANAWHWVVRVRNGTAFGDGDVTGKVPWLQLWTSLVAEMAEHLPDVDMPINYMDESRLLVPHEDISKYVAKERQMRSLPPGSKVVRSYKSAGLALVDADRKKPYEPVWMGGSSRKYWEYARMTCPPGSPSRDVPAMTDFKLPPSIPYNWEPSYAYQGYIVNFTGAMDPCTQPHLRSMHGTFIEPLSISTTSELIPMFGGSKLPMNNEILIPGAMYLTDDPFYSGGQGHGPPWEEKIDGAVWRGDASGGRNQRDNWSHFHRHRLIEMLNATTVTGMETNGVRAMTFEMPPKERYPFRRRQTGKIGDWLKGFADAGFNNLACFPDRNDCSYLSDHFSTVPGKPMSEQYKYKFLPDADGNSFSARFRGFLRSTSMPLKATIYTEWHDTRLVPWLHFAPLDNTFQDLYGVLDYFVDGDEAADAEAAANSGGMAGRPKTPAHGITRKGDLAARWIAEQGKEWSEKVLRREDMRLYVWRLLLEWARVVDDERENLGFVDDLEPRGTGGATKFSQFGTDHA